MRKYDGFQRQINKYLDDVPKCTVHTNEILLRLIVQELAMITDEIGALAHIDYDVKVEGEDGSDNTEQGEQ